jgi:hypothetical protein
MSTWRGRRKGNEVLGDFVVGTFPTAKVSSVREDVFVFTVDEADGIRQRERRDAREY